ncbi:MAG: hypothetical protein HY539_00555 [Deltaproteobacteria bacterium]|nr:hypothetical protein [Deltaproteobacteria bacterium]
MIPNGIGGSSRVVSNDQSYEVGAPVAPTSGNRYVQVSVGALSAASLLAAVVSSAKGGRTGLIFGTFAAAVGALSLLGCDNGGRPRRREIPVPYPYHVPVPVPVPIPVPRREIPVPYPVPYPVPTPYGGDEDYEGGIRRGGGTYRGGDEDSEGGIRRGWETPRPIPVPTPEIPRGDEDSEGGIRRGGGTYHGGYEGSGNGIPSSGGGSYGGDEDSEGGIRR